MSAPRYPVYIISKGRADTCMTANFMARDHIPFHVVVEPQETEAYSKTIGVDNLLTLPFSNLGQGSIPARNWCWEHAISLGAERHWLFDDNIRGFWRRYKRNKLRCDSPIPLIATEDFVDRYENIAIAGFNYYMFAPDGNKIPPFYLNNHVYSSFLIRNDLPYRWRGRYNEDTDLCLQVLSGDWCTILVNAFLIWKMTTMTMKGGNMAELYQGDGRLTMARSLERMWPGVVTTGRRFRRPQHIIKDSWGKFNTPLRLKKTAVIPTTPNEYGLQLSTVKPIQSEAVKKLLDAKR
jgi:hypothetical protein